MQVDEWGIIYSVIGTIPSQLPAVSGLVFKHNSLGFLSEWNQTPMDVLPVVHKIASIRGFPDKLSLETRSVELLLVIEIKVY